MASKKKRGPDLDDLLDRPWCYYCERDFEDVRVLISHQKAKHFKCPKCTRRLNTAGGLSVHLNQVHKDTLDEVEGAVVSRRDPTLEIFAMEGIPDDILQAHRQRVILKFHEEQAAHQALTGNPPSGGGATSHASKKLKQETPQEIKQRLAERIAESKARRAAQLEAQKGGSDVTASQEISQSQEQFHATSAAYIQPPYPGSQVSPPQPGFAQPHYSYSQPPTVLQPFTQTPPPQPVFGPPGQQYTAPGQTYNTQPYPGPATPFQQPFQTGPSRFGAGSPASVNPYQAPQQRQSPVENGNTPRQTNLTPAPGLPPRPAFGTPSVNAFEMQQLHHGHMPGQNSVPSHHVQQTPAQTPNPEMQKYLSEAHQVPANTMSPSGLASGTVQHGETATTSAVQEAPRADKKAQNKRTKMVYPDDEVSPEEKLSELPKYAFHRPAVETTTGDIEAKQTNPVDATAD
ncbi:hypothetical protein EV356DRAFT_492309 [Viridothelium virens]|uniref:C2H2-type domain-containing protein n=1 Tax=Viridothelium virens TaxID=1048519 RepID=A0A6A6GX52_VIRVR|nr:hypothetical protein EV356DRAFT_492309 [Viridothelium virens]